MARTAQKLGAMAALICAGCANSGGEEGAALQPEPLAQPVVAAAPSASEAGRVGPQGLEPSEAQRIRAELLDLMARLDALEGSVRPQRAAAPAQPMLLAPETASAEHSATLASGEIVTRSVLYAVHLASYRQKENARAGWAEILARHGGALAVADPMLEAADLGDRGLYLRLKAGPFDRLTAAQVCVTLTAEGQYCQVTNFSGTPL